MCGVQREARGVYVGGCVCSRVLLLYGGENLRAIYLRVNITHEICRLYYNTLLASSWSSPSTSRSQKTSTFSPLNIKFRNFPILFFFFYYVRCLVCSDIRSVWRVRVKVCTLYVNIRLLYVYYSPPLTISRST